MYLENSEQGKVSGEGELSTKAILAEQRAVPKAREAAALSSDSKGSAELCMKVLVEYTEQSLSRDMDPPLLYVEPDKFDIETELCTHCNGLTKSLKEYPTSDGFTDSDQTLDDATAGLSQLFEECTHHCERFKASESSEHCANHSLASKSGLCCERCPEHLLLFPQCKPSDQHSESSDFEPDELDVNCDSLGQSGMSNFIPGCTDHLELLQQYEPSDQECDSFDSEQDGSTEDSEQSFSHNFSDSMDSLDCATELHEFDESQMQTEYTDDDDDQEDECYEAKQNEVELSDEESSTLSTDTPNFIDVPFQRDVGDTNLYTEEITGQKSEADAFTDAGELCRNDNCEYEATEECNSGNSVEFCTEEDGSSEGSSVETKSFKTCLDDSFPSDPCSDSSEESDKGAQEDSSDELTQWDSPKQNDEEEHKSNISRNDEEQKKPTVNNVIQDYFDLFDRADSYGHLLAQKQHYISCFEGGDIHECLHLEEEVQRCSTKTVFKLENKNEETNVHENVYSEEATEINVHKNDENSDEEAEISADEDDGEISAHEDDGEISAHEDDGEISVHEDDGEIREHEDDGEISAHEDDGEIREHEDDGEISADEDDCEIRGHEDDGEAEINDYDDDDEAEISVHGDDDDDDDDEDCEDATDNADEEDSNQRDEPWDSECQSDDWTMKPESGSSKDEDEERECEILSSYPEKSEEAENDEVSVDGEACVFDGHISDVHPKNPDVFVSPGNEDNGFAPCAQEIWVEGDAYEDKVCATKCHDSLGAAAPTADTETSADLREDETEKPYLEHNDFLVCSEMEPYWALLDHENSGEFPESGVEDYYTYQIRSIQSSGKQALNGFVLNKSSEIQKRDEKADEDASRNESKDAPSSQTETESQDMEVCPGENKSDGFGKMSAEQSSNESELKDVSAEKSPPLDLIHSVVSKHANEAPQTRDSDEEQSDDDSTECCECEYCIPTTQQVPAKPLLSQATSEDPGRICVVIDLDETLVHSSFKPLNNADFIIPVEIEGTIHQVYVLKRPHVDEFLKRMGELFECVLFTASLSKYADPVSDLLDKGGAFQSRLFREACVFHKGNYVKDLSRLGRDLNKVIIIDNSPASYIFHPDNAVPVVSWFDDMSDTELLDLIPFFERLSKVDDIYDILKKQSTPS